MKNLIIIFLFSTIVCNAEIFLLKDGLIKKGKIIKTSEDIIVILNASEEFVIETENIDSIYFNDSVYESMVHEKEKNLQLSEEELAKTMKENEIKKALYLKNNYSEIKVEDILKSIIETEKIVLEMEYSFDTAKNKIVNLIKNDYKSNYAAINELVKDKFELSEEFENRKKSDFEKIQENEITEINQAVNTYDTEKEKATEDIKNKLERLSEMTVTVKDNIKVVFGQYNEKEQFFPVNILYDSSFAKINENAFIEIISQTSAERKEKGLKIEKMIQSNGYLAEIDFIFSCGAADRKWNIILKTIRIIDLSDNMIVMDKKSERYKKMENLQSFVFVKGGTFKNTKSNYYNTQTTLSDFNIGIYEVTQKEWFDIMGNNPSNFKGDTLPVETVSWYDCVEYCNQRSKKEGLKNYYTIDKNKKDPNNKNEDDDLKWTITINAGSNGYRLPTEAEWEYAAGGGQKSLSYELSGSDIATEVAVFYENSNDSTKPVGSKKPNELGLYDMSGNVYEWCWDWYGEEISNGRDPLGPIPMAGLYRLLRGGSWLDSSGIVQVGDRGRYTPGRAGLINGFRVARSN